MSVVLSTPQNMSLRQAVRNWTNVLYMTVRRRPSKLQTVGHRYQSQTEYSSKRFNSNVPKNPNSSETKPNAPPKPAAGKAKEKASAAATTVVEKGDEYKSGEVYYSFNPFSFYEIESQMRANRLPQPDSGEKAH